jgi:hypothetical protein
MAKLITRLFKSKKYRRPLYMGWAEQSEKKKFERTLESWKETPIELMVQ